MLVLNPAKIRFKKNHLIFLCAYNKSLSMLIWNKAAIYVYKLLQKIDIDTLLFWDEQGRSACTKITTRLGMKILYVDVHLN